VNDLSAALMGFALGLAATGAVLALVYIMALSVRITQPFG